MLCEDRVSLHLRAGRPRVYIEELWSVVCCVWTIILGFVQTPRKFVPTFSMPYVFQARYGLFTYAQCGNLDPHSVVCMFAGLGAECIIGREDHLDGGNHLHAFVDFGRRYRSASQRQFDVDGCHPNIVPSRGSPEKGYDYAIKDGDIVGGGLERPQGKTTAVGSVDYGAILDAPDADTFWEMVRTMAPRIMLTNFTSLRSYADWHYRPEPTVYEGPSDVAFEVQNVEGLSEFVRDSLSGNVVGKYRLQRANHSESYVSGSSPTGHPIGDPTPWIRDPLVLCAANIE